MHKELYNKAYQKFTPDFLSDEARVRRFLAENAESYLRFLEQHKNQFDYMTQNSSALELGCGLGSLTSHLIAEFDSVVAVDISELAVSMAKTIHGDQAKFLVGDAGQIDLGEKYDFVFDSHLYHCITTSEERIKYLTNVKKHLGDEGIFLMECMVFQDRLQIPVGYSFDENDILYQEMDGEDVPIRCILKSLEIEKEFQQAGLKLNYFYYHNELSFQVFEDYPSYPLHFLPKTIRLSAKSN